MGVRHKQPVQEPRETTRSPVLMALAVVVPMVMAVTHGRDLISS